MVKPVRRIVTGHDEEGRSVFLEDAPAPHPFSPSHSPNVGLTNLWLLDAIRASNREGEPDPTARPFSLEPPAAGNVVRIVEFPPDRERNYGNQVGFQAVWRGAGSRQGRPPSGIPKDPWRRLCRS